MQFYKYTAQGKSYLILDANIQPKRLNPKAIATLCSKKHGIGADGLLYGPIQSKKADFAIEAYQPQGAKTTITPTTLSLFAHFLHQKRISHDSSFLIECNNTLYSCQITPSGSLSINPETTDNQQDKKEYSTEISPIGVVTIHPGLIS